MGSISNSPPHEKGKTINNLEEKVDDILAEIDRHPDGIIESFLYNTFMLRWDMEFYQFNALIDILIKFQKIKKTEDRECVRYFITS